LKEIKAGERLQRVLFFNFIFNFVSKLLKAIVFLYILGLELWVLHLLQTSVSKTNVGRICFYYLLNVLLAQLKNSVKLKINI
jgi:hypothetical protein